MPTPREYTDEELGLTPQDLEGLDPNIRREIKASRSDRKRLQEVLELQEAQGRELAFFRAGIPGDAKGAYFAAGYTGELSPVAIKAEYDAVFGTPAADGGDENDETGKTTEQLAADKRIADAGGEIPGNAGIITLEDAIKNAPDNAAVMEIIRNAPPEAGIRATN
jgi:hypothetical protein